MPKLNRNSKKRTRPEVFLAHLRKKLRIEPLEAIELRAIPHALRATGDDTLLTTALLGIGKTTLYRRPESPLLSTSRSPILSAIRVRPALYNLPPRTT